MKIDEFVSNVLVDIDNGLNNAKSKTDREYHIEFSGNRGVSFDIAVTTINSNNKSAEGNAKAGFIEVLGAGVGAKLEQKNENSEISRIQFSVYVPTQTQNEDRESALALSNRGNGGTNWSIG